VQAAPIETWARERDDPETLRAPGVDCSEGFDFGGRDRCMSLAPKL
jgi:hypothetical protein